jgi:hypothetical protein
VGSHIPGIFLRVGLASREILVMESGEVASVISQVTSLVDESQGVSLEVRSIKELQLVWRGFYKSDTPSS